MESLAKWLARNSSIVLIAYVASASWPLFVITTENSAPFWWSLQWVGLPLTTIVFYFGYRYQSVFGRAEKSAFFYWSTLGACCFSVIILSYGHVIAVNALFATDNRETITGQVLALNRSQGKGGPTYAVEIKTDSRIVVWPIAETTYQRLKITDRISVDARRGALGFLFNWKNEQ